MELLPISVLKYIKEFVIEEKLVFFNKNEGNLFGKKLKSDKIDKISDNRNDLLSVIYDGNNYKAQTNYRIGYIIYLINNKWIEYEPKFLEKHIMINNKFIPYPTNLHCYHYGIYDNKNIFIKKSYTNVPNSLVDEDNNKIKSIFFPYFHHIKVLGVINNISICKCSRYLRDGFGYDKLYEELVLTKLDKFKIIENTFIKFNYHLHIAKKRLIILDDLKLYIYRLNEETLDLIQEKKIIIKIDDYKKSFFVNNTQSDIIYFLDFADQLYSYDYMKEKLNFIDIINNYNGLELINIEPSNNDFFDEYIQKMIIYKEEKYQNYINNLKK